MNKIDEATEVTPPEVQAEPVPEQGGGLDCLKDIREEEDRRALAHIEESVERAQDRRLLDALNGLPSGGHSYQFTLSWEGGAGTAFLQRDGTGFALVVTNHTTFEATISRYKDAEEVVKTLRGEPGPHAHPGFADLQRQVWGPAAPVRHHESLILSMYDSRTASQLAAATRQMREGVYWNGADRMVVGTKCIFVARQDGASFRIDLSSGKGLAALGHALGHALGDDEAAQVEELARTWLALLRTPEVLNWFPNPEGRSSLNVVADAGAGEAVLVRYMMRKSGELNTLMFDGTTYHFEYVGKQVFVYRRGPAGQVTALSYLVDEKQPYNLRARPVFDFLPGNKDKLLDEKEFSHTPINFTKLAAAARSHRDYPEAAAWLFERRDRLREMTEHGLLRKTLTDGLALDQEYVIDNDGVTSWWRTAAPSIARLNQLDRELEEKRMEAQKNEEIEEGRRRIAEALTSNSCLSSQQFVEVKGDETVTHILEVGPPKYTTRTQVDGATTGFTQMSATNVDRLLDWVPRHLLSKPWAHVKAWCRTLRLGENLPHTEARELLDHPPAVGLYTNGDVSLLCKHPPLRDELSIEAFDAQGREELSLSAISYRFRNEQTRYTGRLQKALAMLASEHTRSDLTPEVEADPLSAAKKLWAERLEQKKEGQMLGARQALRGRLAGISIAGSLEHVVTGGDTVTTHILERLAYKYTVHTRVKGVTQSLTQQEFETPMEVVGAVPAELVQGAWEAQPRWNPKIPLDVQAFPHTQARYLLDHPPAEGIYTDGVTAVEVLTRPQYSRITILHAGHEARMRVGPHWYDAVDGDLSILQEGLRVLLDAPAFGPLVVDTSLHEAARSIWGESLRVKDDKARSRLLQERESLSVQVSQRCTYMGEDGVSTEYILEETPNRLLTRRFRGAETLGWSEVRGDHSDLIASLPREVLHGTWTQGGCPPRCERVMSPDKAQEVELIRQLINLRHTLPENHLFTNGATTLYGPQKGCAQWTLSELGLTPEGYNGFARLNKLIDYVKLFRGEHVSVPVSVGPDADTRARQAAAEAWDKHVKEKQMSNMTEHPHGLLLQKALELEVNESRLVRGNRTDGMVWRESDTTVALYLRTDRGDTYRYAAVLVTYDQTTGNFQTYTYLNPRREAASDVVDLVLKGDPGCYVRSGSDYKAQLIPFFRRFLESGGAALHGVDPRTVEDLFPECESRRSTGYLRKQAAIVQLYGGGMRERRDLSLKRLNAKGEVCSLTLTWQDESPFCHVVSDGEAPWDPVLLQQALEELQSTGKGPGQPGFSPQGKRHLHLRKGVGSLEQTRSELENLSESLSAAAKRSMLKAFLEMCRNLPGGFYIGHLRNYTFTYSTGPRQLCVYDSTRYVDSDTWISRQRTFDLLPGVEADLLNTLSRDQLTPEGIKRSTGLEATGELCFRAGTAEDIAEALCKRFFPHLTTPQDTAAPVETPTPPAETAAPTVSAEPTPTPSVVTEAGKRYDLKEMLPRLKEAYEGLGSNLDQVQFRGAEGVYVYLTMGNPKSPIVAYVPDVGFEHTEVYDSYYPGDAAVFWANREEPTLRLAATDEVRKTPEEWTAFGDLVRGSSNVIRSGSLELQIAALQEMPPRASLLFPADQTQGRWRFLTERKPYGVRLHADCGLYDCALQCSPLGVVAPYFEWGEEAPIRRMMASYLERKGAPETLFDFARRMNEHARSDELVAKTLYQWESSSEPRVLSFIKLENGDTLTTLKQGEDQPPFTIVFSGDAYYSIGDASFLIHADTFEYRTPTNLDASLEGKETLGALDKFAAMNRQRMQAKRVTGYSIEEAWAALQTLLPKVEGQALTHNELVYFNEKWTLTTEGADYGRVVTLREVAENPSKMTVHFIRSLGLAFLEGDNLGQRLLQLVKLYFTDDPNLKENTKQESVAETLSAEGDTTMSNDNTNSSTKTPAAGSTKEPSLAERAKAKAGEIRDTAKEEAVEASWQLAGKQLVKLVKEPMVAMLCRKTGQSTDSDFGKRMISFLETEAGTAMVASILAIGLTAVPGNDPRVQRLAREMRVKTMADAGDLLLDVVTGPLRQVISSYLADNDGSAPAPLQLPAASPSATEALATAHMDNPLVASMNGHAKN